MVTSEDILNAPNVITLEELTGGADLSTPQGQAQFELNIAERVASDAARKIRIVMRFPAGAGHLNCNQLHRVERRVENPTGEPGDRMVPRLLAEYREACAAAHVARRELNALVED